MELVNKATGLRL